MPKNKFIRFFSIPLTILAIFTVYFFNIPNPIMILIIPVMLFTYMDGYISGFLSGFTVVTYSAYYFFTAAEDGAAGTKALTVICAAAAAVTLIGRLKSAGKRTIGQLRQAQGRFIEEEERVRLMLDATPLICTLWDREYKVYDCNEEAVRVFGVKDKEEVCKRFYEFSPELQINGRRSGELAIQYIQRTYEKGKCSFNWTHQTADGTQFPCEVTLIRAGAEAGGYTVLGYARDLREQKRMTAEIERRDFLLHTVNQVAEILLRSESDSFDNDIRSCMGMLGASVNADRVTIWRNHARDGKLYCSQIYEWLGSGEEQVDEKLMTDVPYDEALPGWEAMLSHWDCVSSLVSDMAPEVQAQLSPKGILSIFLAPVFVQDKFWGYLGFDNCHEARTHTETEQSILRSGSLLLAHAFVRYEMTKHIRETAALLQNVVENYPGAIWHVDSDGMILLLDGMVVTKLGIERRVVGKNMDDLPRGTFPREVSNCTRRTFTEGAQEGIFKTERGAFHIRTLPIYDGDGNMTGMVGNCDDITEIIRLQDDLEEAFEKANEANMLKNIAVKSLESIMNSIDAMIYVTVPETGELLFINNVMKEAFKINGDELSGKYCYKVFRGADKFCDFCPCYRLSEEPDARIVWEEDLPAYGLDIRHSDCLIDWPDGHKAHLQHAIDITELVSARESAEQSNRAKGVFIAQMSHEIRTPINAILGISEIQLREGQLSADAEEGFSRIYASGDLLLNIINDILDFSKIDAGKMEIIPNKYDIPSLISDTVQLCRLRYESKPIGFSLRVDEGTPLELIGDELRIKQILNNLLSNAFKYTDSGEVSLSVASEPGGGDMATLVFVVSDTGQGMTEEQTSRIFDEYLRFNMEKNYGIPGTGLGMNITKRLIDMMGGEIFVESEIGKGTAFTLRLPQKDCGTARCGPEVAESLREFNFNNTSIKKRARVEHEYMPYGRVLVVDDVESNLYVAKGLLLPYGLQIETVRSGFDAIERINAGNIYDIIFMDHMMPVMDGIKATEIIRGSGYTHPIVALTANAITGQSEMFLANGFDRFISKPIDSRELDMALTELIRNRKPPEVVEAARREREKAAVTPALDMPELIKYFIMDANGIIDVLENVGAEPDGGTDTEAYTIAVHGIKSALASIGEAKLSEFAFKLEKAGAARNFSVIAEETPVFTQRLRELIAELKQNENETDGGAPASDEDMLYLNEKLSELKTACEAYNIRAAKTLLDDLTQKTWPQEINGNINELSLCLLRGEFKKAVTLAEGIMNTAGD